MLEGNEQSLFPSWNNLIMGNTSKAPLLAKQERGTGLCVPWMLQKRNLYSEKEKKKEKTQGFQSLRVRIFSNFTHLENLPSTMSIIEHWPCDKFTPREVGRAIAHSILPGNTIRVEYTYEWCPWNQHTTALPAVTWGFWPCDLALFFKGPNRNT